MQEYVESVRRRKISIPYKPYVRRKHVESILVTRKNIPKKVFNLNDTIPHSVRLVHPLTMLFSYGYGRQRNRRLQKMQANQRRFWLPCRQGNMARCTSPDGAHQWLHAKQLNAAISQVPAPYCPGGHHGWWFWMKHKNTNKTQFLPSFLMADDAKKQNNF